MYALASHAIGKQVAARVSPLSVPEALSPDTKLECRVHTQTRARAGAKVMGTPPLIRPPHNPPSYGPMYFLRLRGWTETRQRSGTRVVWAYTPWLMAWSRRAKRNLALLEDAARVRRSWGGVGVPATPRYSYPCLERDAARARRLRKAGGSDKGFAYPMTRGRLERTLCWPCRYLGCLWDAVMRWTWGTLQ